VAVNCWVLPAAIDAVVGATVIVRRTPDVTVRTAVPCTSDAASVAVMVLAPVATPVAIPWEPEEFETVAAAVFDDDQVAVVVRFCVLRSE
jgi:hypothetical protein